MTPTLSAIAPIFLIIATGYLLFRTRIVDESVWSAIEHICFYLLLPFLIIRTLSRADLGSVPIVDFMTVLVVAILGMAALLILIQAFVWKRFPQSGPSFSSIFQGATRFHGFVAIAVIGPLYGDAGVTLAQLSGGQAQRVAVARSLVFDPDLVLMDEPLGALDKNLREQMQYEIKHIHENLGLTVVYVTHDQSEALTMSNRIAVFDDGIIQQCDPPPVLYEEPENAFVAGFIGENNRFVGKVIEDNGDTVKVAVDNNAGTVVGKKVNVGGVGERSTLSLRPERVTVNPEPGSLPNIFSGLAEELIYLGDHIRTRFTVLGHDDFIVKIPNSAVHAHLKEGDTVNIGWNAEDCRALDPSD